MSVTSESGTSPSAGSVVYLENGHNVGVGVQQDGLQGGVGAFPRHDGDNSARTNLDRRDRQEPIEPIELIFCSRSEEKSLTASE